MPKVLGLWDEPNRWQHLQNSNLYHEFCQPRVGSLKVAVPHLPPAAMHTHSCSAGFQRPRYHIALSLIMFSLCLSIQWALFLLHPAILPPAKANFPHDWRETVSFEPSLTDIFIIVPHVPAFFKETWSLGTCCVQQLNLTVTRPHCHPPSLSPQRLV